MPDGEIQAVLSRSIIEETDTTVRLHKGQEYPSGILPKVGGQQYRSVRVELPVLSREVLSERT